MERRNYDLQKLISELETHLGTTHLDRDPNFAMLEGLRQMGQEVTIPAGEILLKTGFPNEALYLLLEGKLDVVVGGERVAELRRKGDLVGEMSIISGSLCSADVITAEDSRVIKISTEEINKQSKEIQLTLYKIFCLTLAAKLEFTNIKARNFERLNRTLEEQVRNRTKELQQKNNELILGFRRLEDLHRQSHLIINNLGQLREDYLQTSLDLLAAGKNTSEETAIIHKHLLRLNQSIQSLQSLDRDEEKMAGQKVLVVESNPKHLNLVKIALGGTGIHTELCRNLDEAKAALEQASYNIIFLSADMLELAEEIKKRGSQSKIILFTEEESKDYLMKIKDFDFISNIIAKKEEDRAFNIRSIATTVKKMISGDIFGLEKYLNWGVEVQLLEIFDSSKRQEAIEKVIARLSDLGIRSPIRTRCQIVIEELLMNAIYDAPVDSMGKQIHNGKSRTEQVILTPDQSAKLRVATDGIFVAVSVEDPFGAFPKKTIFDYLKNNYFTHDESFNEAQGKGGAGKGLFMITENSDLIIYNVSPGLRTEVIALFDLEGSQSKRCTSLHYFEC